MKIAVYTAVIPSDYTVLRTPLIINSKVDYFVFTDEALGNYPPWNDVVIKRNKRITSRRDHTKYKMQSHKLLPEYDFCVWMDGCVLLKVDPQTLVDRLLTETDRKIAFGPHPWRTCIYEEAECLLNMGYPEPEAVKAQMERYRAAGYPEKNGLVASTVFVRDNRDPDICRLMDRWLEEYKKGAARDQLSLNYSSWAEKVPYFEMDFHGGWHSNFVYEI